MIRHRHIEGICALAMVLALALTGLLFFGERLGIQAASAAPEYAARLFDGGRVHTVDIQVGDPSQITWTRWEMFVSVNSSSDLSGKNASAKL